jgi:hypothetical protein
MQAPTLIKQLRPEVLPVGVFVDMPPEGVAETASPVLSCRPTARRRRQPVISTPYVPICRPKPW